MTEGTSLENKSVSKVSQVSYRSPYTHTSLEKHLSPNVDMKTDYEGGWLQINHFMAFLT